MAERDRVQAVLGRYEVGEEIGRGAFGVVWSALHRELLRPVAVKVLLPRVAEDPTVRARFLAEAQMVAILDHPHVVPIYDYLEQEGLCLLVMERLRGGAVSTRLAEGTITPEWACAVALAAAAGLHHAHERGVLHRDVKPENLLLSSEETIKVTDFGIAKVLGGRGTRATATGSVLGTPAYMAPEQAEGVDLGPQADVYALGVMLYELLSGRLPFSDEGGPLALLLRRLSTDPRPLAEVAPSVPPPLANVVMAALTRSPADRFHSAEAFAVALGHAATASWGPGWMERAGTPLLGGGRIAESVRPTGEPLSASGAPPDSATHQTRSTHRPPVGVRTSTRLPTRRLFGTHPDIALAAERLYRESRLGTHDPAITLALRDGGVRRDLERIVVDRLATDPEAVHDAGESILAGAVSASGGDPRDFEALEAFRRGERGSPVVGIHRFLDFAARPSRWGDAYASTVLPDGRTALFRILVQIELSPERRQTQAEGFTIEVDEAFGRGATEDPILHKHIGNAATAALDYLGTDAPGCPVEGADLVSTIRVFRGGLPWPLARDLHLPLPFEQEKEQEAQRGSSMGLPVALAVLHAFMEQWTTWAGPICAATGTVTVHGSVEAVGEVEDKALTAAAAGLPFLFPRRGILRSGESRYRHVAVDDVAAAASTAFNLTGADVDGFLCRSPRILYGRDRERAQLEDAWRRAQRGNPGLALVQGAAGIGKSGLVATFLMDLTRGGVRAVFGRAERDASQVFEPIVRRLVEGLTLDELRDHAGDHGAWLGSVVEELRRFLPEQFGEWPQLGNPTLALERKSRAICALIRQCAETHAPLMLVVDDVQWGKEETWPVLRQLLDPAEPAPILVVATYRHDADGASPDAEPSLAILRAAGVVDDIELAGLSTDILHTWVASALPDQTVPAAHVSGALEQVTAGNPLQVANHLEKLASRLRVDHSVGTDDLVAMVHEAGRDVVAQRLRSFDGLAPLKLAATVRTPEFSAQLLDETGLIDGATLRRHLLHAQAAMFITSVGPGRYTFTHQTTREAVRALVPPEEAAEYNLALATALERRAGSRGARLPVVDLARHFAEAAPFVTEAWEKALDYADRAAQEATRRFAYDAAREFRVLALQAFDFADLDIPERRCQLLLDTAQAHSFVGLEEQARPYFREARELAVAESMHDLVVEATLGFAGPPEDKGTTDDEMLGYLEETARLPAVAGDHRRARLRGRSTFELVLAARREPEHFSMPPVVDILEKARASGETIQLTWALLSRLMGHWPYEEPTRARLDLVEEMLALADTNGEKDISAWALGFKVIHLLELGQRDDAERAVEALTALARELHYGYARWGAAVLRPMFAHLDGRFEESRLLAEEAQKLRSDSLNAVFFMCIQRIVALREEGEVVQVERQHRWLTDRLTGQNLHGGASIVADAAWSLVRSEVGDLDGARHQLDEIVKHGLPTSIDDPWWITGLAMLTETCAHLEDLRLVPRLYELLMIRRGECVVVSLAMACLGAVDRYLGILAGLEGDWDAAEQHFEAAMVLNHDRLRSPTWTAHTEADRAAVLARRRRPNDVPVARELCASALAVAKRLKMPVLQSRVEALLTNLR